MNPIIDAFAWIFSPERLTGSLPLPEAIAQHLAFTFASVAIAALIAIPAGWAIGHTGRGREFAVALSGAARAVPSFGLIVLLVLILGVVHKTEAAVIVFVLLAIPSILAGAYSGVEAIDRHVIDAGRAMGMTPWQVFWRIEVPLGLPLLIGGLRSATLQVVATVTIAAYVGLGGLGYYILQGIPLRRFDQILGASILVVALALILDGLFALLQRAVVPRGVSRRFDPSPFDGSPRTLTEPAHSGSAAPAAEREPAPA
ncbi:osmoprotectant transport system permease protein [Microbacterium terrae]|uniref:Glycine betaine/carnitine/choline transport system permease protein OpuCB n=1 Tax=Microbacterium terrae TaxID=69369 RepID=A0A0M2GVK9_9MICO|nr:ABC transporter permease subunit [Microbacterium terrae]KJL37701.1 Glycine betaine/carnitine/choline transport system permease protein OpuCB [Microbacterium terrae]MBP1076533.1 osmoprotectant transport system permease protein [Microbacterium terrae]GLJ97362.1 ABC transporter permease [Microbacterium terrae]